MELKFEEVAILDKDNVNGEDGSITVRSGYPRIPGPHFEYTEGFDMRKIEELMVERSISMAKCIANDIIIPDPTPQKIFLDTTRLLAEKTNNLLEELWKYIEDGKLTQSAILLLAAQEQIRGGCSSSSKKYGFDIIKSSILRLSFALIWGKGSNEMPQKLLEEMKALHCAGLLVDVISRVGEPLSAYIQAHSEVPHVEVLEHVSSILKEYGFRPTGDSMDTLNLQPYDCNISNGESCGSTDANRAATKTANLHAAKEKAVRKQAGGGWDPTYAKRRFFPYWRSVLQARFPVKVYPTYARTDARSGLDLEQLRASLRNSMANCSTPTPNIVGPVGRISLLTRNNQPTRRFITTATGALKLLKALK